MMLMMAFVYAEEWKVYKEDYASYSNLLATIKGDKIYKGDYVS